MRWLWKAIASENCFPQQMSFGSSSTSFAVVGDSVVGWSAGCCTVVVVGFAVVGAEVGWPAGCCTFVDGFSFVGVAVELA